MCILCIWNPHQKGHGESLLPTRKKRCIQICVTKKKENLLTFFTFKVENRNENDDLNRTGMI